ncbi:uncharacterized protein LOC129587768 isoform X2 [Paramacrobiotus metropolitanus]|uniref:uncharacterized protein LOC129587768 isoform X2 n=1 Tax=Paramacrobiotus metropolitanus TaxID=2943436 RepID=UPI002445C827|nr:uncharacterized protein LOC129587768 isoform X2 [Paramacrobiotus metropolitanus]
MTVIRPSIRERQGSTFERLDKECSFVVADEILRMQVDFLVSKAGAPKQLRKAVKNIWFSYLSIALPDVSAGVETTLMQNQHWLGILRENDFSHLIGVPSKEVQFVLKFWQSEHAEVPDDGPAKVPSRRRTPRPPQKTLTTVVLASDIVDAPERLLLPRVVAILILSLHICHPDILTSDLIRWMRALQLPYSNPALPPRSYEIFKAMTGIHTKEANVPSYAELEFHFIALCKLFGIEAGGLPKMSVVPVIERFIMELNLPDAILPMVVALAEKANMLEFDVELRGSSGTETGRRAINVEAFVISLIIYVIRALFGLDGMAEQKITKNTHKLQKLIRKPAVQLFDFDKWMKYMSARRLHLFRHTVLFGESCPAPSLAVMKRNSSPADPVEKESDSSEQCHQGLQSAFSQQLRDNREPKADDLILLPPTYRPFRAHSEALSSKYLVLLTDFKDHQLRHLLPNKAVPKGWKVVDEETEKAESCLGRIQAAQNGCDDLAFPLRAHSYRGGTSEHQLCHLNSESMKWLIRVCAEMIEQSPESLLGQLYYLELGLFPRNPVCGKLGKAFSRIKRMRQGE